jgi:signal transduction histidine kinase
MRLPSIVISFLILWLLSVVATLWYGDLSTAGNFGDSFGAVNALFSGVALALAIYSMILQQRQNREFEQKTMTGMARQAETIELIRLGLVQQANVARVNALAFLIEREEQRVVTLRQWGQQTHSNENHYAMGIQAAKNRAKDYQAELEKAAAS